MSGGDGPAEGGRAAAGRDRSATAYTRLRELIVHGRLAPGSRIVETDVAERLGVSRTPVRAALQRLEQEGFVLSIGGQQRWRPTIAPLTREDARELFFIIGQIEGLPAGMAAELDDDRRSALVARLRDINRQLLRDSEEGTGDPGHYFELDSCFHRTFVEAVAGPRLLALHDAIKPQAERYIRVYTSALLEKIGTSTNEHEAAIRAIELGDADAAQRAIEQNWRGAARRLGDVIERLGERGSW
jgi:DNA-binding GntR family transcriptional regulator